MKITELKSKLDFYVDSIYQQGYDLGYESALEEFDRIADALWNQKLHADAEILRMVIKSVRKGSSEENL